MFNNKFEDILTWSWTMWALGRGTGKYMNGSKETETKLQTEQTTVFLNWPWKVRATIVSLQARYFSQNLQKNGQLPITLRQHYQNVTFICMGVWNFESFQGFLRLSVSFFLSVHLSTCISIYIHPYIYLSDCISEYQYIYKSIYLSQKQSSWPADKPLVAKKFILF